MSRDTRTAIIDGAARSFGKLGFAATRVEDILVEAGVSRATFYKFFDSKERVFDALEESFNVSFLLAMQGSYDEDFTPEEQAEALVDAYLRWLLGWRNVVKTMWLDPSRPRFDGLQATRELAFRDFTDVIAKLMTDSGVTTGDEFVYRGILGAVSEIGLALIEKTRLVDSDFRRAREAVIQVALAAVTPPIEL